MSDYNQLSNYTVWLQLYKQFVKNKAATTPITFEEIVMVVIKENFALDVVNK